MFTRRSLFLTSLTGVFLLSCAPAKEFPKPFHGQQLQFGQGGGFTGGLDFFVLLDDGRLFKRAPMDSSFTLITTWEKPFVQQMFSNYHTLRLDEVNHYEPGDKYYFIQYQKGTEPLHRIAWGKPGFVPDPKTVTFYNMLFKSTKSKS